MPLLIFLLFAAVPIAEIAVFIEVGSVIGVVPTLAFTVLTAFMGVVLLRVQGLSTFARAQAAMEAGEPPVEEMVHGVFLAAAGILLLVPGFLTDAAGFLLFIPPVRLALGRRFLRALQQGGRVHVYGARTRSRSDAARPARPPIIEGEVIEEIGEEESRDEKEKGDGRGNPKSPWKP